MSEQTNKLLHLFSKLLFNPRMMRMMHREFMVQKLHQRGGRTGAQGLLIELWQQDGLTNAEIAELLDIKPSSVTAQVKNLENEGLVERQTDENDKRVSRVFLTAKGKEAREERAESRDGLSETIFGALTKEEQFQLETLLSKLLQAQGGNAEEDFCPRGFFRPDFDPHKMREMARQMHHMSRESGAFNRNRGPHHFHFTDEEENWNDF